MWSKLGETIHTSAQYIAVPDTSWQILHMRRTGHSPLLTRKLILHKKKIQFCVNGKIQGEFDWFSLIYDMHTLAGWKGSIWTYGQVIFTRVAYAKLHVQSIECMGSIVPMLGNRSVSHYFLHTSSTQCILESQLKNMDFCSYHLSVDWIGTYRDESAPLFVGTALALSALAAVAAYGVWRYVWKVEFSDGWVALWNWLWNSLYSIYLQILENQESSIWQHGISIKPFHTNQQHTQPKSNMLQIQ